MAMLLRSFDVLQLALLLVCVTLPATSVRVSAAHGKEPYTVRISCGAREDVKTPPTNTLWYRDFGYTGGRFTNATLPSPISPPLKTLRFFPLSDGPENCYNINNIPNGHYEVRLFFGLISDPSADNEPIFDISIEGTQIYSLKSGWSNSEEQSFVEALVHVTDTSLSTCFHSTGHGDPSILSIEILQIDDKSYEIGPSSTQVMILRTAKRLTCGSAKSAFDEDYGGNHWGGDRFWLAAPTFAKGSDQAISTVNNITLTSTAPNFYPEQLYKSAIVGTDVQPGLQFQMEVEPNKKYSIWLHLAEIDQTITGKGQRVFDVVINGVITFSDVDIIGTAGKKYAALVLNKIVEVTGAQLTLIFRPKKGSRAIINAIEVFEVIVAEVKTSPEEGLDNQGLKGFLPDDIGKLKHLQNMNLSDNGIYGAIPYSLGTITGLEILDLSFNQLNGTIPESLGQLTSLQILNLNGNSLSGRVPATLGGRPLHRASFNFTGNAGLCGIPGLRACGPHLSVAAKVGIVFGVLFAILLVLICMIIWWKRRENILRAQKIAARGAPYAKARTQHIRDVQMTRARSFTESSPNLLT